MNELKPVKSEMFGEVERYIYSNNHQMYMTAEQLGKCPGHANPRNTINALITRNNYLRESEFSVDFKSEHISSGIDASAPKYF